MESRRLGFPHAICFLTWCTMHFHESLPSCLDVLTSEGVPLDESTLIVRDATGRLTVGRVSLPDRAKLAELLKRRLEGYAGQVPVVDGTLAQRLLDDPAARIVDVAHDENIFSLRYIDRRLAGADWIAEPPSDTEAQVPRLVFASIKGGVGRSTALSVLASNLAAQGKRVLAIDLDLEAPGIGFLLLPNEGDDRGDRLPKFGVIDYLVENGIDRVPDDDLIQYIGTSNFHDGSIDVIPAIGRVTEDRPREMIQKLARAVIEDIHNQEIIPFWKQVSAMIQRFESRKSYDVVLIDSRAGLADIAAAPIMYLGAEILFFGVDQEQTFKGYRFLLSHISSQTDFARLNRENDWRQKITFVQSKAGGTERARKGFREKIYDLCTEWFYEDEGADSGGEAVLTFGPAETGVGVPHDATFIKYDAAYEAFDPTVDGDQLDPEVYAGPFGHFLKRVDVLLAVHKDKQS